MLNSLFCADVPLKHVPLRQSRLSRCCLAHWQCIGHTKVLLQKSYTGAHFEDPSTFMKVKINEKKKHFILYS